MNKPDYSSWITKQDAAKTIGVSTKAIERWAQESILETARWKRPSGGPAIVVIHPRDVERLAREKNPEKMAFVVPPDGGSPGEPGTGVAVRQPSADQLLQALVTALQAKSQTSQTRLWLTLKESAEYSGLPAGTLLKLILTRRLPALDVGRRRRGGRWRIRKVDLRKLDAIALETHYKVLADPEKA